jgi:WD40 repeat protein
VWSGDDGTHLRTLVGHTGSVTSLAVAPDGRVYSGSHDNTIRVWSPDDGAHLQTLAGHTLGVTALVVGPHGKVFSGSRDGTVRVWSADNGAHLYTIQERSNQSRVGVYALALGRDGTLYSGGLYSGGLSEDYCRGYLEIW